MRKRTAAAIVLMCAAVAAHPLAQTIRGTVTGTITDSTGAVVPGVAVTMTDSKTGIAPRLPGKDDEYNSGYVDAIRHYTTFYQDNIAKALQEIPNVLVSVNVQIDSVASSTERERKYDAKSFPYKTLEDTQKEESTEAAPQSEPGVIANQPWFLDPGYLAPLTPRTRAFFERFVETYRKSWLK